MLGFVTAQTPGEDPRGRPPGPRPRPLIPDTVLSNSPSRQPGKTEASAKDAPGPWALPAPPPKGPSSEAAAASLLPLFPNTSPRTPRELELRPLAPNPPLSPLSS